VGATGGGHVPPVKVQETEQPAKKRNKNKTKRNNNKNNFTRKQIKMKKNYLRQNP
jgi:hypothetical protein